jgi:AcrR family transcriptional regulator
VGIGHGGLLWVVRDGWTDRATAVWRAARLANVPASWAGVNPAGNQVNQTIDVVARLAVMARPAPTPAKAAPAPADTPRGASRSDGEASRERLMLAGLRLFAHQGFAATSTRELAQAAGVNIAAISYYFGDKAGLYRAVFFEPLGDPATEIAAVAGADLSLADALSGFYRGLLEPLAQGEDMQLCVKLRMREMIEPTGLWDQEIALGIRPMHEALLAVLCRHLGLAAADDDIQRLAVCLMGLAVHLHVGRDVIDAVAPQLNRHAQAAALWGDCLLRQALAMVEAERVRRAALAPPAPAPAVVTRAKARATGRSVPGAGPAPPAPVPAAAPIRRRAR